MKRHCNARCGDQRRPPMMAPGLALAQDGYTIGVSNTVQGNGWREEMICAIKAQALASGNVASLNIAHRNTDAAGQLEDIRNLIAAGVDAIVVNPSSPEGVNSAIKEATDAGIVVVAVDQAVTEQSALRSVQRPGGIRLSRRQVALRADGRRGRRGLHARRGRRVGRQRPRRRLQARARRVPGRQHRARGLTPAGSRTRASSRSSTSSPPASPSTASGPPASTT